MSGEQISTNIRLLLDDLALIEQQDGTPAIVLVKDYGERDALVTALQREATIHGIELVTIDSTEDAVAKVPALSAAANQAAALLLRAGSAPEWGRWLDANRERLPTFCRFVLVFVLDTDLPALARAAPAFMSWAKGRVIERLTLRDEQSSPTDVAEEVQRMRDETGRTPEEFVAAWERGDLEDTYKNNVWLNLARDAIGGE